MTGRRRVTHGILLAAATWLSGCATPSPQTLPATDFWTGRIGVQIQSQPPQNLSAAFELQGTAERGELLLLSPLGNTLAALRWTPEAAHLAQGERRWSSDSLDQLTEQLAGTPLPVAALFDWMIGQATTPAGWQVDLSQWVQGRIQAERQHPLPAVQLRVVLER